MKRLWSTEELASLWSLSPDDVRLTADYGEQAKLGLMCQLAFWREHARFPDVEADIARVRRGAMDDGRAAADTAAAIVARRPLYR